MSPLVFCNTNRLTGQTDRGSQDFTCYYLSRLFGAVEWSGSANITWGSVGVFLMYMVMLLWSGKGVRGLTVSALRLRDSRTVTL